MRKIYIFCLVAIFASLKTLGMTIPSGSNASPKTEFDSLVQLYRNVDKDILLSEDSITVTDYIIEKNREIIAYLEAKYPERRAAEELDPNEAALFIFGLIHAMAEANDFQEITEGDLGYHPVWFNESGVSTDEFSLSVSAFENRVDNNYIAPNYIAPSWNQNNAFLPAWFRCAMTVIGGTLDVVGLYNEYVALFKGGATMGNVMSVLGKTLRRHFGWFAAAYLVYEIADECF